MENTQKVVTRFAPSPTGAAHAGGYRTAMYAWLYARGNNGKFILRIEDTNKEKNVPGSAEEIQQSLTWLGISWDEMYLQSENLPRHQEVLKKLIAEDKAYISPEEAKDGSGVIKDLIRFRNPNKKITFTDKIRGEITVDTTDLEDFIIARNIDEPVYHLAVVVDDHDEGVTCVIRAEEHISNTPRHILIMEALGFEIPEFAHLPLVLTTDKKKLSKRKGATAMYQYAEMGYLPEAVFNYVAMCGWNPGNGTEEEIFSKETFIKEFSLERVQKSPAVFNEEKLNWYNREYIKKLSSDEFWSHAEKYIAKDIKLENLLRERIVKFNDIKGMVESGELSWYFAEPALTIEQIVWKNLKEDVEGISKTKSYIAAVVDMLETISESDWNKEHIKNTIWSFVETTGKGEVLWPMRLALSGLERSPDPFELSEILGKTKAIARLRKVLS